MEVTERLALPLLSAGQAQKEIYHNEALLLLDLVVGGAVEEPPRNSPPAPPAVGSCYLVGASPTGEWASRPGQIAAYTAAGWRYLAPADGVNVLVRSTGNTAVYRDGAWEMGLLRGTEVVLGGDKVVGVRRPAIADPVGGTVADVEARAAIAAILTTLRAHGLIEQS